MCNKDKTNSLSDREKIRNLIESQFASLNWSVNHDADWETFRSLFFKNAQLIPSARPVKPKTVGEFEQRMRDLKDKKILNSFSEKSVGMKILVVGNIGLALTGCEMTENISTTTRDVSAFLLVKNDNNWQIIAQGWEIVENFEIFNCIQ